MTHAASGISRWMGHGCSSTTAPSPPPPRSGCRRTDLHERAGGHLRPVLAERDLQVAVPAPRHGQGEVVEDPLVEAVHLGEPVGRRQIDARLPLGPRCIGWTPASAGWSPTSCSPRSHGVNVRRPRVAVSRAGGAAVQSSARSVADYTRWLDTGPGGGLRMTEGRPELPGDREDALQQASPVVPAILIGQPGQSVLEGRVRLDLDGVVDCGGQ